MMIPDVTLLALKTPVVAFVVPRGARETSPVRGMVVGRTRERNPRYDVRAYDGTIYREVPSNAIEAVPEIAVELITENGVPVRAA